MQDHSTYLRVFSEKRWLVVFGPVAAPKETFGVGIWELPDDADIHDLCNDDPVIRSGLGFKYEIAPMPIAVVRK